MTTEEARANVVRARDLLDAVAAHYDDPYDDYNGIIWDCVIEAANRCDAALEEFDWVAMQQRIKEDEDGND